MNEQANKTVGGTLTSTDSFWKHPVVELITRFLRSEGMLLVLLLLIVVMGLLHPRFFTARNLTNIALQSSVTAIVAMGVTYVLISGGIDLSVGSVVGLSAVLLAGLTQYSGWPEWAALFIAVGVGLAFGAINGLITTRLKVDSIVVTLGTWYIARGLVQLYVGNKSPTTPPFTEYLGSGRVFDIPMPILIALGIAVISHLILTRTNLGRYCFAIGGNEKAARLSGVKVERYRTIFFVICGLYASLAAIVMTGRLFAVEAGAGGGLEFAAPAAAVVGGTSLYGGRGSMSNAIIGSLIMGVIANGLNLLTTSFYWQQVAVGAVIILAVSVDTLRRRRAA